jgi:hypothetical protein
MCSQVTVKCYWAPRARRRPSPRSVFDCAVTLLKAVEVLADLAFLHSAVRPYHVRSELVELARLVQGRRAKTILEIGTRSGAPLRVVPRCVAWPRGLR